MTTNQTIDGVPRELLVRLSNFHATGWEDIEPEIKELRALLDAPLCKTCHDQGEVTTGETTYQGHWQPPEPVMESCPECGGETAAQPQDEPVAWMDPRSPEMHATISNEVKQHNLKIGGAPAAAVNGYSIPLYAEQPAPAPDSLLLDLIKNPTIEMQEAGSLAADYDLSQNGAAKVWLTMANMGLYRLEREMAALADEVTRLNTK